MNVTIEERPGPVLPPGSPTSRWKATLDLGSKLLQQSSALKGFDVYVVGFHPAKDDPSMQMEAHHYCKIVNDDFLQCVLFDGNTDQANLIGIEYIISAHLFGTLPEEEKDYWHPHNFEVLSGQLVAPGMPEAAEKSLMKQLMNSYGKTWHLWHSGRHDGEPGMPLPMGESKLMWSFNRERECDQSLIESRNRSLGIDSAAKSASRQDFLDLAHPQQGVDTIADQFPGDTQPIPGVVDEHGQAAEQLHR